MSFLARLAGVVVVASRLAFTFFALNFSASTAGAGSLDTAATAATSATLAASASTATATAFTTTATTGGRGRASIALGLEFFSFNFRSGVSGNLNNNLLGFFRGLFLDLLLNNGGLFVISKNAESASKQIGRAHV